MTGPRLVPTLSSSLYAVSTVSLTGVSSGIDMGLALAGRIAGDHVAQAIQLMIEYDPQPPYDAGSPDRAPAEITGRLRARSRFLMTGRRG